MHKVLAYCLLFHFSWKLLSSHVRQRGNCETSTDVSPPNNLSNHHNSGYPRILSLNITLVRFGRSCETESWTILTYPWHQLYTKNSTNLAYHPSTYYRPLPWGPGHNSSLLGCSFNFFREALRPTMSPLHFLDCGTRNDGIAHSLLTSDWGALVCMVWSICQKVCFIEDHQVATSERR